MTSPQLLKHNIIPWKYCTKSSVAFVNLGLYDSCSQKGVQTPKMQVHLANLPHMLIDQLYPYAFRRL